MDFPGIADVVRNFGVMVRIQGPDPKGLKMRKHAFHHYNSGKTTLSASGMIFPDMAHSPPLVGVNVGSALVLTVASIVEPFLSLQHRENISEDPPELIPGVMIDIMVENTMKTIQESEKNAPFWLPARLLTLVEVPESSLALQSLIKALSGSSDHGWEVGWSLSHQTQDQNMKKIFGSRIESGGLYYFDADLTTSVVPSIEHGAESSMGGQMHVTVSESANPSLLIKPTIRIAILRVPLINVVDMPKITVSPRIRRGDRLLAMGSPFGALSPVHFFNSISAGSIANCYPPNSSKRSLLMADIRGLPGMEGCPVFDEHARLIGILSRPLRQKTSDAEVQLVIPWEAIVAACTDFLPQLEKVGKALISNSDCVPPSQVEKSMASVCLITVDNSSWASGVLLNDQGLILTNAHLLEPWRFRKTTVNAKINEIKSKVGSILSKGHVNFGDSFSGDNNRGDHNLGLPQKICRSIRVRLDHKDPWIWCDARVVYVSKGPLDIALLQLEVFPDQLHPFIVDFDCPSLGSKAFVIGHGLYEPQSDLFPSISSGIVAKVVKAQMSISNQSASPGIKQRDFPAMLETTATVHSGGSGGAVVNSDGHLIGLVTSNARHGGGTVIPHLNFSIPCAALEPVVKFARDMEDLSLLEELDQPNEHLSSIWALIPPPLPPKPGHSFPNVPHTQLGDNTKQEKGSRFAKFIAERHQVFKTQLGKADTLSIHTIPSKL